MMNIAALFLLRQFVRVAVGCEDLRKCQSPHYFPEK